ncbi:ARM repeat-containing protein, partial [Athelia psychrophila]
MRFVKGSSDDVSSVAAQALLHMLVYADVAKYIIDNGLTEDIVGIALDKDTKVPVSAARILEELVKHDCTRTVMVEHEVPKTVFELWEAGKKAFINSSRLNALCKFSAYDDLRPALLEMDVVPLLVDRAGQKDKDRRKACLAALIKLAEHDIMREEILKAGFDETLMKQLGDEDTDRDAQSTLVSLCTHGDFRSHIIQTDFLKTLVHRLGNKKHFDGAQYTLNALIQYDDVQDALLELGPTPPLFISTLEDALDNKSVILDDFGNAMFSFCSRDNIRKAIIQSRFVDIILEKARTETIWGLEVTSRLLQSDFLKIPEFRTKLVDGGLVTILNHIARCGHLFALTFIPAILSCAGEYDDMREAMLASDIIFWLTTRMRDVSISHVALKSYHFHREIHAKFVEYGFNIDKLDHVPLSLSLSRIFRLGRKNNQMIHSLFSMAITDPKGFKNMVEYRRRRHTRLAL